RFDEATGVEALGDVGGCKGKVARVRSETRYGCVNPGALPRGSLHTDGTWVVRVPRTRPSLGWVRVPRTRPSLGWVRVPRTPTSLGWVRVPRTPTSLGWVRVPRTHTSLWWVLDEPRA